MKKQFQSTKLSPSIDSNAMNIAVTSVIVGMGKFAIDLEILDGLVPLCDVSHRS